jgi:hypothetical protein
MLFFFVFQSNVFSQTLCSQYGSSTYTLEVGVGSASGITTSSQIGGSLPSGTFLKVVGDFTVDNVFYVSNAVIKVSSGKKILVYPANYWSSSAALQLVNTKIFACGGLWKGIELSFLSILEMTNCRVEDAEIAVNAKDANYASIYSDGNIFDRNKIGFNLETTSCGWWCFPVRISYLHNTKFWSTSALNDGSARGDVGIKIKNVAYPLAYNYGNSYVYFKGLEKGVEINGSYTIFDVNHYYFDKIEDRCIEFIGGDLLNVTNSVFFDINKMGVYFENSRSMNVSSSSFHIENRNQTFNYFGRFGVFILNPSSNNDFNISNNAFYFSGKLRLLSHGIDIETNGGVTETINANILNNEFKQQNDFPTFSDPTISYSLGVSLSGNYSSNSNVSVQGNTFNLDAPDGSGGYPYNTSISVRYGDKNNIKVVGNRLISGDGRFCEFVGSIGMGNEFSDNKLEWGINYNIGMLLFADDCENLKVCSNNAEALAPVTYLLRGQSPNMDFSSNTTYGNYQHNLWITNNGVIGLQTQKNNKWFPAYGTEPFLQHNDPAFAEYSQFKVHTDQTSVSSFSEYFPANIDPNNGDFFVKEAGSPNTNSCILLRMAQYDPSVDNAIADGSLSKLYNSPARSFDADLHLQRKVKRNNNLFNGFDKIKDFSKKHESSNISKFVALEELLSDAQVFDSDMKSQLDVLNQKIKDSDKKNAATRKPNQSELKQAYKERGDLNSAKDVLYKKHRDNQKLKFKKTKNHLNGINAISLPERYFKEVHQIYVDAQLNTEGVFTEEQIKALKKIAGTCVEEGGKIVYVARGYLNDADRNEVLEYVKECEKVETPSVSSEVDVKALKSQTSQKKREVVLYPNPSNGLFVIELPSDITGKMELFDLTGRLVKMTNLISGSNSVEPNIPNGVYIAKIVTSDGDSKSTKLTINK